MQYKILIVDDDRAILDLLKTHFEIEDYMVFTAVDYNDMLQKLKYGPDLILLDVGMPEVDGFSICSKIRDSIACPIIFLTARVEEQDKIIGLRAGGDDYIVKPFSLEELMARVEAHLRREERRKHSCITRFSNDLFINYSNRSIHYQETEINFTKREFDIIELLTMNSEQVFSKDRIYEKVWGYDSDGDSDIVKEFIRKIRRKFTEYTEDEYIKTVWGVGYQWKQ